MSGEGRHLALAARDADFRRTGADEIARLFAREEEAILVHLAGQQPFRLNRIRYDLDAPFRSRAAPSPYH